VTELTEYALVLEASSAPDWVEMVAPRLPGPPLFLTHDQFLI
jgi:hypothetical protein